ncbi:MAG TPA: leucine--tRNA ligase [Tepidisphaeraceae bacterium]|nr:leucine--tRNA ligase [Tepidisphaeraceae bacterium]
MPYNFTATEKKWQHYWLDAKPFAALDPSQAGDMPKAYVLDMFPYPSGAGLHVGHPEGYTATDIVSRFLRMKGYNVLHPMGWDAFGLPAEQYAIERNIHPAITTQKNIDNFRRQIQMIGLSYDWDREVNTTDPRYYKWTQWIFLQLFNSYFDPIEKKAKPISHLVNELLNETYVVAPDGSVKLNPIGEGMKAIAGEVRVERAWSELSPQEQREIVDGQRLAYMDEIPVNWCPALGTVLSNEEIIDGKSERGGFPVERRPLRQWLLRITAYADRLLEDLETLDWPGFSKELQKNWIGRSVGAEVDFEIAGARGEERGASKDDVITVFTTRPDTLYGATYMVLAPEHPLVDRLVASDRKNDIANYRAQVSSKSDRDRLAETRDKTGVFIGAYAINPVNDDKIPIYIADYVLMSYGTGAIMAVPAHDQRDFDFAKKFNIPIRPVVKPLVGEAPADKPFEGEGIAINSPIIDGMPTAQAKEHITETLAREGNGIKSVNYKLRDWLFSRQRYWGEPFPIVLDEQTNAYAVDDSELPVQLPELADYKPTGTPQPPLSKAVEWGRYEKDGKTFTRETNTMPQWAGSCWYYLRYIDPQNEERFVDPVKEKYWMSADLYIGGVEHAVLHLLYSRFWHKVLYDLGHVSTPEPFQRLVHQGLILGQMEFHAFSSADGSPISADELTDIKEEVIGAGPTMTGVHKQSRQKYVAQRVDEEMVQKAGPKFVLKSNPSITVDARAFKMSKSRGNVVNPDDIVRDYGADCFRLYEMYLGPLEASKPWNTRDIVGMSRFLNSVWRNLVGDEERNRVAKIVNEPPSEPLDRMMHYTIRKITEDIPNLRFNTAIAELIKLNNELTGLESISQELAENFVLMLAPFAPHIAEEIWQRLGHERSLARHAWPQFDEKKLVESSIELPVQVNGKLRDKITVPADADEATIFAAAENAERVKPWLQGKTIRKRIYASRKLVNFVVG